MSESITPLSDLHEITALLGACGLPTADLAASNGTRFFGIGNESGVAAVVGVELHGEAALLRSLAVASTMRGNGIGHALVAHAEGVAVASGVKRIYLLTMSAANFFARLGYVEIERSAAPPTIQATAQFTGLCPASSTLMCKPLEG